MIASLSFTVEYVTVLDLLIGMTKEVWECRFVGSLMNLFRNVGWIFIIYDVRIT